MTDSMVERVARALYNDKYDTRDAEMVFAISENMRDSYCSTARAALKAIREPTEAEMAAAYKAAFIKDVYQGYSFSGAVWRAMIDAALAEKP